MRARSNTEIVFMTPRATATTFATTARASDRLRVRTRDAATFWPMTVWGLRESRYVPTWIDVLSRLPRAEKTLPRSPMAAGTSTSRPGRRSNVPVMEPRTAPAARLVALLRTRATMLWRAPSALGPRRPRRRLISRGRPSWIRATRLRRSRSATSAGLSRLQLVRLEANPVAPDVADFADLADAADVAVWCLRLPPDWTLLPPVLAVSDGPFRGLPV